LSDSGEQAHQPATIDPGFWETVVARRCAVPPDRPLDDMTVELVALLGEPDPHLRDDLALRVLTTWVATGVYDDLLSGVGDGVSEGLRTGLGEEGTLTVLRRSFSARVLAATIDRDSIRRSLHPTTVLDWGDRGLSWLVAERDLRGHVPGAGRAHAIRHGAELLRALACSRHLDEGGLMVLLDTLADRLLRPTTHVFVSREEDVLAYATMALLHRNLVDNLLLEQWVERLAGGWAPAVTASAAPPDAAAADPGDGAPVPAQALNTMAYARALHLQLLLGVRPVDGAPAQLFAARPAVRVDLLAALQGALRSTDPRYERAIPSSGS
jgi:hypothetical protein